MDQINQKPQTTSSSRKNPYKTNLILAMLLIVLGSAAYWFEYKKKPMLEKAEEAKTKLFKFESTDEVESLDLVSTPNKIHVNLKCKENCKLSDPASVWEITSPISFGAESSNVGTFITGLITANVIESFTLDTNVEAKLREFGLSPLQRENKKVVIKFKKFASPFEIYFGEKSAVGENVYSLIKGEGQDPNLIRIIPAHLFNNVTQKLTYWRNKKLINYTSAEVQSVAFTQPKGSYELKKEGKQWFLVEGGKASAKKVMADNESVETFLAGLVHMNVHEYVSDDKAKERGKLGLPSKPHYQLLIKTDKSSTLLEGYDVLVNKTPKFYTTLGDKKFIAELERSSSERFSKKADSFRFKNLLTDGEVQLVEKVKFKVESKFHEAQKQGKEWKFTDSADFDPLKIDQALATVSKAKVDEFLGKGDVPAGNVELSEWMLSDKAGHEIRKIKIYGTNSKGNYYAKIFNSSSDSSGKTELVKLEQASGNIIPSTAAFFQKGK